MLIGRREDKVVNQRERKDLVHHCNNNDIHTKILNELFLCTPCRNPYIPEVVLELFYVQFTFWASNSEVVGHSIFT